MFESVQQESAVREACQGVVEREVGELDLEVLAVGDVDARRNRVADQAVPIEDRGIRPGDVPAGPILADPFVVASIHLPARFKFAQYLEQFRTLLERDEEVERAMGINLGGAVAADGARRGVVAGQPALGIDDDHDRPDRVDDRRDEVALIHGLASRYLDLATPRPGAGRAAPGPRSGGSIDGGHRSRLGTQW